MQQAQALVQHVGQHLAGRLGRLRIVAVEPHLGRLDVPVAIFVPEELIELASGLAQLPVVDQPGRLLLRMGQAAQDPAIGQRQV